MNIADKWTADAAELKPAWNAKFRSAIKTKGFLLAVCLFFPCVFGFPLYGEKNKSLEQAWGQIKSAEPHFSQGLKEFSAGRHEKALSAFQSCILEMPRHANAHYYLANLYYIRGDYQNSLVHMEHSLADFAFIQELSDYAGRVKGRKLDSFQQMLAKQWDETTSCRARREIESLADDLSTKQGRMELLAEQQQVARSQQKAHYLYFLGNIYFQLKQFPEASQKYHEAIELNPRHASAYNNAAALYYLAGEHRAALGYLERAEKQGVEDNLNLKLKYLVYQALGQPTEGILKEDLSPGGEYDLGVMRFALAFSNKDAMLPPLYENGYVAYSRRSRQAVIIDPGVQDSRIGDFIREKNLEVRAILNTHGHEDHTGADRYLAGLFGAPIWVHRKDAKDIAVPVDHYLDDGKTLNYDGLSVRVIHTPGHTPGSVCFLAGDFLFSGDTLFKSDIGKVWTENADKSHKTQDMLVQNIKNKLMVLPGQTWVCPGHGKMSTIADERADNPFLKK